MRALIATVVFLSTVPAFAEAVKKPVVAPGTQVASVPQGRCDAYAKKLYELAVIEVGRDAQLRKEFPNAEDFAAAVTLARSELRKEQVKMIREETQQCLKDVKSGDLVDEDFSCVQRAKTLSDLDKC